MRLSAHLFPFQRYPSGDDHRSHGHTSHTPLESEFEELDQISFDTIQRRVAASQLAANQVRNRYHDIVPYDANRVRLREALPVEEKRGGG